MKKNLTVTTEIKDERNLTLLFYAVLEKDDQQSSDLQSRVSEILQVKTIPKNIDAKAETVEFLISLGANLETVDNKGLTPLYHAVKQRYLSVSLVLIKAGANTEVKDSKGLTPFYYAALQGDLLIALALIEAGANIEIYDSKGLTPLYHAIERSPLNIIECQCPFLPDAARQMIGAQIANITSESCEEVEFHSPLYRLVEAMLNCGIKDIDVADQYNLTGLFIAVIRGDIALVKLLLSHGANPSISSLHVSPYNGKTMLRCAIENNSRRITKLLKHGKKAQFLTIQGQKDTKKTVSGLKKFGSFLSKGKYKFLSRRSKDQDRKSADIEVEPEQSSADSLSPSPPPLPPRPTKIPAMPKHIKNKAGKVDPKQGNRNSTDDDAKDNTAKKKETPSSWKQPVKHNLRSDRATGSPTLGLKKIAKSILQAEHCGEGDKLAIDKEGVETPAELISPHDKMQASFALLPFWGLMNTKKYQMALKCVESALEWYPCFYRAYFYKALVMLDIGNYSLSHDWFDKALEYTSDKNAVVSIVNNKIQVYIRQEEYSKAYDFLKSKLVGDKRNANLHENIASILLYSGQFKQSIDYSKIATNINPNVSFPYIVSARAYASIGQFQKALACYNKALVCCNDGFGADLPESEIQKFKNYLLYSLGLFPQDQNLLEEADTLLRSDDFFKRTFTGLKIVYEYSIKYIMLAKAHFEEVLKVNAAYPLALRLAQVGMGIVCYAEGDIKNAEKLFLQSQEVISPYILQEVLMAQGLGLLAIEKYDRALACFALILEKLDNCVPAHIGLAKTYNKLGNQDQTVKHCTIAYKHSSEDEIVLKLAEALGVKLESTVRIAYSPRVQFSEGHENEGNGDKGEKANTFD